MVRICSTVAENGTTRPGGGTTTLTQELSPRTTDTQAQSLFPPAAALIDIAVLCSVYGVDPAGRNL